MATETDGARDINGEPTAGVCGSGQSAAGVGTATTRTADGVGKAWQQGTRATSTERDSEAVQPDNGRTRLEQLIQHMAVVEEHMVQAVKLAGRLAGSGDCERVEGLPLELFLALAARMTGGDRHTLITAGQVLDDMPETSRLWEVGQLSWGQVRGIVIRVKGLGKGDRATVDRQVAATCDRWDGLDVFSPDQLLDAVDRAVDEIRRTRSIERREQRRDRASFLSVQPDLFSDRGTVYGELDAVKTAKFVNLLDDAADQAVADTTEDDKAGTSRQQQWAAGLEKVCDEWLAGNLITDGDPDSKNHADNGEGPTGRGRRRRRPKASLLVHVDLRQVTNTVAGQIELNLPGVKLPRLTAKTVELLANDADMRAVIFDGARPLAASKLVNATHLSTAARMATKARDKGGRFPGSDAPAGHCDIHHITPRAQGGDHHPDNLNLFARRPHGTHHEHGWNASLDPDTGEMTFRRDGRTWRSIPHGTPLEDDPNPPSVRDLPPCSLPSDFGGQQRRPDGDRGSGDSTRDPPGDLPF